MCLMHDACVVLFYYYYYFFFTFIIMGGRLLGMTWCCFGYTRIFLVTSWELIDISFLSSPLLLLSFPTITSYYHYDCRYCEALFFIFIIFIILLFLQWSDPAKRRSEPEVDRGRMSATSGVGRIMHDNSKKEKEQKKTKASDGMMLDLTDPSKRRRRRRSRSRRFAVDILAGISI
ncbi:hypothetical protein ASPWEDRAFT_630472 [Aspergillus wentii DTO 134E9]|uniref:Uncharacterized protein n=1 Tax=Aspergillus wentii DTO 134E9 TaxID=1073089 RepID=A0A1L9RA46_ASPWE|nr:uncharacterized protein ASPWEDRAFT_630472 [Aspergillus wentii DTO 134E9]OJJ31753.1 hypothetical protein ASPWEDRAFT_630472 [Aspergillus wentii DTO 134E9]